MYKDSNVLKMKSNAEKLKKRTLNLPRFWSNEAMKKLKSQWGAFDYFKIKKLWIHFHFLFYSFDTFIAESLTKIATEEIFRNQQSRKWVTFHYDIIFYFQLIDTSIKKKVSTNNSPRQLASEFGRKLLKIQNH